MLNAPDGVMFPRIRSVETLVIGADFRNWVLVKVVTDEPGLVGWGEATLEFRTRAVVGAVADLEPLLVGERCGRIEYLWQAMFRQQFFKGGIVTMSAISGIDQALHDLKAKVLGIPLYELLGGAVRDRVRLYDHLGGGRSEDVYGSVPVDAIEDLARATTDDGFTALKIIPVPVDEALGSPAGLVQAETFTAAARRGAGPDVELILDFHGRTTPSLARRYMDVLLPFRPWFVEEPCQPENVVGLAEVRRSIGVPVATGERLTTAHAFAAILDAGGCDIVQPDVCHCGGVTEIRRIAALADIHQVALAPHNPLGPVATAVNLHVAASTPNFLIQEVMRSDVPWRDDVTRLPFEIVGGHASLPTGVGIGIDVDETVARRHPYVPERQIKAVDRHGAVADW